MAVIEAKRLSVRIPTEDGIVHAVQDVSFTVEAGQLFGIVGESGSGKSVLAQAVMGLLSGAEVTGEVLFEGVDLLALDRRELRAIRGSRIGMIFQDPLSSLHPYFSIGSQITEMIHTHERVSKLAARARAIEMLERVGIPNADERFDSYPHQFSGGMRQRVMIAMALVLRPALIIADEPTTALDVTVQAQILELLESMRREFGTTVIMITHDLGLLSSVADQVMVMYAGNRLEIGPGASIFSDPAHPYTAGLLRSSPANYEPGSELVPITGRPPSLLRLASGCVFSSRCPDAMDVCHAQRPPLRVYDDSVEVACWLEHAPSSPEPVTLAQPDEVVLAPTPELAGPLAARLAPEEPVVSVSGVRLAFGGGGFLRSRASVDVLKGIDLELRRGETLGLVGESGCGKSTLARVIAGLIPATEGTVTLVGKDMSSLTRSGWQQMRKEVQLVFQDPFGSLNPKRRVGSIIGDPYRIHGVSRGSDRKKSVQHLMEIVGLNPEHYNRFPSEFSGGQRQRIGIARALALNPSLIICDEPVSALDVSIQAQVLNLMKSLQREFDLSYLFISHDLSVVRHICDRIAVMSDGVIVEMAETEALYANPRQEFTRTLLAASVLAPSPESGAPRILQRTIERGVAA
ncbi:dipeptide ABC transporter ATP-binding protein [Luethyella okanaganae]|uniref:Dipeptide ABC transporter ATP-binding protein n=1 Tax=Luethyella okanaganae TaxID=69372 RepID=A0ABW1VFV0_9MICO